MSATTSWLQRVIETVRPGRNKDAESRREIEREIDRIDAVAADIQQVSEAEPKVDLDVLMDDIEDLRVQGAAAFDTTPPPPTIAEKTLDSQEASEHAPKKHREKQKSSA